MVTWKIVELERNSEDGLVTVVHWEAIKLEKIKQKDLEDKVYSSRIYGAVSLKKGDTFLPFEELTEEIVVGWVKNTLGQEKVEKLEEQLAKEIDLQKNPPLLKGLPW